VSCLDISAAALLQFDLRMPINRGALQRSSRAWPRWRWVWVVDIA
jgi:hypothetical protein